MPFDVVQLREQFAALHQVSDGQPICFLDGPGGTQVPDRVIHRMSDVWVKGNSNLGGAFASSKAITKIVLEARSYCQALLNAPLASNIVFGANMTTLTFSLSRAISRDWHSGDEVIVTELDHYANVSPWKQAAKDRGAIIKQARIDTKEGSLDVAHLLSLINDKTRLVAVSCASNTTGSITDIKPIIETAHRFGAQVYLDAVHFAPHHLIDVQEWDCDFLVCSAYKFFGPQVGIAYVASPWLEIVEPYKVEPAPNVGPARFETGTQSFAQIAGVTGAIDYLASLGGDQGGLRTRLKQAYQDIGDYEQGLSSRFLAELKSLPNVSLIGRSEANHQVRTPTFALRFKGHTPQELARALGAKNICVWSGHFYAIGLINALGIDQKEGVLRVGCMHYNTESEIERFFAWLRPWLS